MYQIERENNHPSKGPTAVSSFKGSGTVLIGETSPACTNGDLFSARQHMFVEADRAADSPCRSVLATLFRVGLAETQCTDLTDSIGCMQSAGHGAGSITPQGAHAAVQGENATIMAIKQMQQMLQPKTSRELCCTCVATQRGAATLACNAAAHEGTAIALVALRPFKHRKTAALSDPPTSWRAIVRDAGIALRASAVGMMIAVMRPLPVKHTTALGKQL